MSENISNYKKKTEVFLYSQNSLFGLTLSLLLVVSYNDFYSDPVSLKLFEAC